MSEPHFNQIKNAVVEDQRIQDLLCCALEGGSNYWYLIQRYQYPEGQTRKSLGIEFEHLELPFKGGSIIFSTMDEPKKEYTLDLAACIRGLEIMAEKHPKHFADFIAEDEDADTGDVFLQFALFGDVIYS
jgi:hypothetical protein